MPRSKTIQAHSTYESKKSSEVDENIAMARLSSSFIVAFMLLVTSSVAVAQTTHFTFTSRTGNNAIVAVLTSATPNVAGAPLVSGDEIGVFTPAGLCVGGVVWTGSNTAITVWGNDSQPPAIDGIRPGEQIYYRVWRQSTNTEYPNVSVTYSRGNGIYAADSIYILSSLSAAPLPPLARTLLSPANGATGVSTSPTLSWNASAGATSYRLQVSTSSIFSTTVVDQSGITTTSYVVSGLANSALHYWRVNATNAGGTSAYSAVWNFGTVAVPPAAPALVAPPNGANDVSTSPVLSWNTSAGATSYELQVSANSSFSTTLVNQSGITGTSYSMSGLANNMVYYWRVNATNAAGMSDWSTVWGFTTIIAAPSAPTLLSPANGAAGVPTSPTLSWNASAGATSYRLQVSTNAAFSTAVLDQGGISGTSYAVTGLANETTYYWRVSASNAGGTSDYSLPGSFTTIVGALTVPTLLSPPNLATTVSASPILRWSAFSGAYSYRLQVSTSRAFSAILIDQSGIVDTFYSVTGLLSNTTYYWRVNVTSIYGTSDHSTAWSFTTGGRTAASITRSVTGPGLVSFNEAAIETFVSIDFTSVTGTGSVTVNRYADAPNNPAFAGPPPANISQYRWVISQFGLTSLSAEVRINVSQFPSGTPDPSSVIVFSRPADGSGPFNALATTYDSSSGELRAAVSEFSEFVLGSNSNPLTSAKQVDNLPQGYHLEQNYPNPFNPTTTIRFFIANSGYVTLKVFNLLGVEVQTLLSENLTPGKYSVEWNGLNASSGVYFYRLMSGSFVETKKMLLLR